MTEQDKNYVLCAMAPPCKARVKLLLEHIDQMLKRKHAAGYIQGHREGYVDGMKNPAGLHKPE